MPQNSILSNGFRHNRNRCFLLFALVKNCKINSANCADNITNNELGAAKINEYGKITLNNENGMTISIDIVQKLII